MTECWTVCEQNWERARERGYDEMSASLKYIFGEESVSNRLSREDIRRRIERKECQSDTLVIVGHRTDLSDVGLELAELRMIEGLKLVELQFTTQSVGDDNRGGFAHDGIVPYCSIRKIVDVISGASSEDFSSQERLNEWFDKRRAQGTVIDPLLPLAVLVDGFLACPSASHGWFKYGVESAISASGPSGVTIGTDAYWSKLRENKVAVERLLKAIKSTDKLMRGSTAVLMAARKRGWGGGKSDPSVEATELYGNACDAVKAAWHSLTSNEEMPRGEETLRLIEAASVGFHVLAVGHL